MDFIRNLFGGGGPQVPREQRQEVDQLIEELIKIGKTDDFLSERPGGLFNAQCHHIRTRAIGRRLNDIGGLPLMQAAYNRVRRKVGKDLTAHLEYAWADIGQWMP